MKRYFIISLLWRRVGPANTQIWNTLSSVEGNGEDGAIEAARNKVLIDRPGCEIITSLVQEVTGFVFSESQSSGDNAK